MLIIRILQAISGLAILVGGIAVHSWWAFLGLVPLYIAYTGGCACCAEVPDACITGTCAPEAPSETTSS